MTATATCPKCKCIIVLDKLQAVSLGRFQLFSMHSVAGRDEVNEDSGRTVELLEFNVTCPKCNHQFKA